METHRPGRIPVLMIAGMLLMGLIVPHYILVLGQTAPERFWLAGRYDGNRIIVYFNKVKFNGTLPKDAVKIAYPIADAFFSPIGLSTEYVARFQQGPGAEHFSIGDRYDLLVGDGRIVTVTLTSLVGFDSGGIDSFVGALAILQSDDLLFTRNYYVVRRHVEPPANTPKPKFDPKVPVVRLDPDHVPFDIEAKVAALMINRVKTVTVPQDVRARMGNISPTLEVQRFTIADGSTRYHVWADWRLEMTPGYESIVRLGAWIVPLPSVRFLAVEPLSVYDGVRKEDLLNAVSLGSGRTGIVIYVEGEDSRGIELREYKDGVALKGMRLLNDVSAGG